MGRTPKSYNEQDLGRQRMEDVIKGLNDMDLNIYLTETDFEAAFKKAIQVRVNCYSI